MSMIYEYIQQDDDVIATKEPIKCESIGLVLFFTDLIYFNFRCMGRLSGDYFHCVSLRSINTAEMKLMEILKKKCEKMLQNDLLREL